MERTGVAAQAPEREGEGDIGAQVRLLRRIFQITPVPGLIFDSNGHLYPCRLRSAGPELRTPVCRKRPCQSSGPLSSGARRIKGDEESRHIPRSPAAVARRQAP